MYQNAMSQALSFLGRLDRREESIVMSQLQERRLLDRLLGSRDPQLAQRLFGSKKVRDVYTPPTHGTDGTTKVMPKN